MIGKSINTYQYIKLLMKGKCYKKISLTLDFEDIKVLRKLNPEINISEITRKAIKAEIKQELGLKCREEMKENG